MPICVECKSDIEKYANGKKCRSCYNAYMAEYMLARYHRRRIEAIADLGGECVRCGSKNDLEFDHVERELKSEDIGKLLSQSERRYRQELEKCQLLCRACHREKTNAELTVGHGGGKTGVRNCYCELCKPLKQAYMREWSQKKRAKGR